MKVFYVIDSYDGPYAGTEKQLLLLIRGMQSLGHDTRLFVLRHTSYTRGPYDFPCPIELLDVQSIRSVASIRHLLGFRARLARERPDVVHAFFNDAAILVPMFCRRKGTRVITSRRDMGFWYSRATLILLRLANRRADSIVCNCRAVARHVRRMEWIPPHKLAVIYNGLTNHGPGAHEGRRSGPDTLRVCLLANIRPIKRIEDFIQAAAVVSQLHHDVEFVIVGEALDQAYHQRLQSLSKEFGLTDRLLFAGRTDAPAAWLGSAGIGVLTSSSEGLSNSILEYMSAGLPVICSDVGGNPELVTHDRNGYLYSAGDVESLTEHLRTLCADSSLRMRFGLESRRRVEEFSQERMLVHHLRLYESAVQSFEPGGNS